MTILEAVVWCFGIMVAGITICRVAGSFSRADKTLEEIRWDFRKIIENQDEARHERQMQEEAQYDRENNSEGR